MKLIVTAFALAAVSAVGLGAQSTEVRTKTKIEVKDGKDVTLTGCVERNPAGGYMLTDVANGRGMRYVLISDDDLSKNTGRRVEVKGKAADQGKGKVKVDTTVKTSGDKEAKAVTETKGDLGDMPYLGVTSVKVIAESCR